MDLQRKEYPAMLETLQPAQAVAVLNDRMRHVNKVNTDIADWLNERRRIEEQYVQGLSRLAQKHLLEESLDLGIFSTPWQKIVSSVEALAESHHNLAQKIEVDIEMPLRNFASSNREVQAMSNISGNLTAMAKEIETAQKKAEKLDSKGSKAAAGKVASTAQDLESANAAWDSQAPFVFEKLQAVDESRLNHLRDALTQLQTHELDSVERNRVTAEQCLNSLLNVETADEIKTFSIKAVSGHPRLERVKSRPQVVGSGTLAAAQPPPLPPSTPERGGDDGSSHKSSLQEPKSGVRSGLKRFTTVLGRRRQSTHPYAVQRGPSPEQKSASNLSSSLFGRGKAKEVPPVERTRSPSRTESPQMTQTASRRLSSAAGSPVVNREAAEPFEGGSTTANEQPRHLNGATSAAIPQLQEPLQPSVVNASIAEPQKDAEGFSVPPSGLDAISQAEQEAATIPEENPAQQFKVDIRNAPIQEEDGDADAAIANVTNALRMQAAPSRKNGTVRGRRAGDVRNTMFLPPGQTLQMNDATGEASMVPITTTTTTSGPIAPTSSSNTLAPTLDTSIAAPFAAASSSQISPFKANPRHTFLTEDPATSDTQSVRSGRSLSSAASTSVKHPELHGPGLNSSVVETVSTWFEHGQVVRAMVTGQVALAYNPVDITSGPFGTSRIRLENFPVLEKVAPNPAFIEQTPSELPGHYTVDLAKITKVTLAFHYQVHLDPPNSSTFSPLLLSPAWKPEANQTSAILNYSLNPSFSLPESATSITLSNLIVVLRLDPLAGKATHAQSKPPGNFSKERGLLYWRLGDVTLSPGQPAQQLRVRFFTEGEAKPGTVEARWDLEGAKAEGLGSGLSVSRMVEGAEFSGMEGKGKGKAKETDPFADEDGSEKEERGEGQAPVGIGGWEVVQGARQIGSGTYVANA